MAYDAPCGHLRPGPTAQLLTNLGDGAVLDRHGVPAPVLRQHDLRNCRAGEHKGPATNARRAAGSTSG